MRKKTLILVLIVLALLFTADLIAEAQGGLPQLGKKLPDPGEILGSSGEVYDENYMYRGTIYRTYLYDLPATNSRFLSKYETRAKNAGFTVEKSVLEGHKVLKLISPKKRDVPALLFYDYQGFMLLMVPPDITFNLPGQSQAPKMVTTPKPSVSADQDAGGKGKEVGSGGRTPIPVKTPTKTPVKTPTRTPTAVPSYRVGQEISFGKYDGHSIRWQVLEVRSDRILLISKKGLAARPYNLHDRDVTWETCTLRTWLNNTFYYSFSSSERDRIIEVRNINSNNREFGTKGGNSTDDRVFLLSIDEVNQYMPYNSSRQCAPEDNIKKKVNVYGGKAAWWLRTPSYYNGGASVIATDGRIDYNANVGNSSIMVRPAMWIKR